jgi:hypothetical protein
MWLRITAPPDGAARVDALRCAARTQRSFEERLGQRIGEMDEAHRSRAAALDSSLLDIVLGIRRLENRLDRESERMDEARRSRAAALDASLQQVHHDMHHLASSLLEIAVSIRRLEGRLDRGRLAAPRQGADGGEGASESPQLERASAGGHAQRMATALQSGPGSGGRSGMDSGACALETHGAGAEQGARHQDSLVQVRPGRAGEDEAEIQGEETASAAGALPRTWGLRRGPRGGDSDADAGAKEELDATSGFLQLDTRLVAMDRKLEKIAASMGIRGGANAGDDEEDRKRLKEKLKYAIELDKRSRIRSVVSEAEVWLEYIFGICTPDQRTGKRGSR